MAWIRSRVGMLLLFVASFLAVDGAVSPQDPMKNAGIHPLQSIRVSSSSAPSGCPPEHQQVSNHVSEVPASAQRALRCTHGKHGDEPVRKALQRTLLANITEYGARRDFAPLASTSCCPPGRLPPVVLDEAPQSLSNLFFASLVSRHARAVHPKGHAAAAPLELPLRALVCVLPQGTQLANGLRHIISCAVIAEQEGMQLFVDPSKSLSAGFFMKHMSRTFNMIHRSDYTSKCRAVSEDDAYEFVLRQHPWTNWHPLVEATFSDECFYEEGQAEGAQSQHEGGQAQLQHQGGQAAGELRVSLSSIYAAKPKHMMDAEYLLRKVSLYSRLEWPKGLRDIAEEWSHNARERGFQRLVGVHVRYTDNLRDANKVNNGLNTPIEAFCEALAQIGADRHDTCILLCTDSMLARQHIAAAGFKCERAPSVSRERYTQALFEMLLLGQTDLIVGSSGSTFSFEAAFLGGGTDILLCTSGLWQTWHFGAAKRTAGGAGSSASCSADRSRAAGFMPHAEHHTGAGTGTDLQGFD